MCCIELPWKKPTYISLLSGNTKLCGSTYLCPVSVNTVFKLFGYGVKEDISAAWVCITHGQTWIFSSSFHSFPFPCTSFYYKMWAGIDQFTRCSGYNWLFSTSVVLFVWWVESDKDESKNGWVEGRWTWSRRWKWGVKKHKMGLLL